MFQRRLIVTLFLGCFLSVLSHNNASAFGPLNHACCVKYTVKPLPISMIRGYVVQSSREVCRIDAIIFHTIRDKKVCASAKDEWVKTALAQLSSRLKTLVANADHHPLPVNREP